MRPLLFLTLCLMSIASPTFAQQSAWELFRSEHPSTVALLEARLGNDMWREEQNRPLQGPLSLSIVSYGTDMGDVYKRTVLMNSGATPLCVYPDIVVTGGQSMFLGEDESAALLPPYSSRLIAWAEGSREGIGSFNERVEVEFGAPSASGRCSGHSAALPTPTPAPTPNGSEAPVAASARTYNPGDWRFVLDEEDFIVGYNHASMRITGSRRLFWALVVEYETTVLDGVSFDYHTIRISVKCDEETITQWGERYYVAGNSTPVRRGPFERAPPATNIEPGTIAAALMEKVCGPNEPGIPGSTTIADFVQWAREEMQGW